MRKTLEVRSLDIAKVGPAKRIDVLLRMREDCIIQLADTKKDEAGWLKAFIAFYGAIIFGFSTRWIEYSNSDQIIEMNDRDFYVATVILVLIISNVGTVSFITLLLKTRWSYYGTMRRLMRIEYALQTNNPDIWGYAPSSGGYSMGIGGSYERWKTNTQFWSSFFTRVVNVIGGNICVCAISFLYLYKLEVFTNFCWTLFSFIILVMASWVVFFIVRDEDYDHFLGKTLDGQIAPDEHQG